MRYSRAVGILSLLAFLPSASAGDDWICLHSPNFELYTREGERSGRGVLRILEEVRAAFKDILKVKLPGDQPATIVAFGGEQEYAPYRLGPSIFAYYYPQPHRDFIVIQDLLPEHLSALLHEYTHLIIHQAGMKLPLWLNEGFAEFYGTMRPVGGKIVVGRVIPERLRIAEGGLANLRVVLKADSHTKGYGENLQIFYAESWALVHMLKFGQGYSQGFEKVLDAIGQGVASDQALESVYGKPIEAIQADLDAYVHGEGFVEGVIHARMEKAVPAAVVTPKDPVETDVMLAGILARGPNRDQARKTLEKLAKSNPGRPEPLDALARLYLAGPNPEFAIAPFRQALEAGTHDSDLCFNYAVKLRNSIPEADYVAALRRATEIDPQFSTAQQLLAAHAFNARDYPEAVKRLHLVKKLDRANAFTYYRALSFAAFQIGNRDEARSAAMRAQQYASSDLERRLADEMASYVAGSSPLRRAPELPSVPAQ